MEIAITIITITTFWLFLFGFEVNVQKKGKFRDLEMKLTLRNPRFQIIKLIRSLKNN